MGKGRRIRAQRRSQPRSRLINNLDELEASGIDCMPDMPCRLTFLDDEVLGGMQQVTGIQPDGTLELDRTGTVEPLPVVLFEPAHTVLLTNRVTGLSQEARVEGVIAGGFHRLPDAPAWALMPASGWEVRRVPEGLVLRDATGDIWARSQTALSPAWVSAAASYRHVAVFFGPQLGVRVPPGMKPAAYSTAKRAAEFRRSREQGLIATATVAWRGEPTDETLEWVTFLPGSFGLPFAGIFAPGAIFNRVGGPEMFGLNTLRDQGMGISPQPVRTILTRVSRTDIDLIDPAEDSPGSLIGGVHYTEGVQAAWRRAALSRGKVILLTGRRLPAAYLEHAAADPWKLHAGLADLRAAMIPVQQVQR